MTGAVRGARDDGEHGRSERRRRRVWEASVDRRLAKLEKAMYTLIGVATATAGTAIWNLAANISQGGTGGP